MRGKSTIERSAAVSEDRADSGAARAETLHALGARLRGDAVAIAPEMLAAARRHRVHLLLAYQLPPSELAAGGLAAELREAAIVDAWRQRTLRGVIDDLASAGIAALVLKGAALAHTCYAAPFLRPRRDVDLLTAHGDVDRAERRLLASGWQRAIEPDAALASAQRHYSHTGAHGLIEHVDLHWNISNARVFADAVGVEELQARSVALPALGPHGRVLARADALLLACVHRVAHHFDTVSLLWLWDIHVLVSALTSDEAQQFIGLATRSRMRAVCARGILLAAEYFQTAGAAPLAAALAAGAVADEPSARFMASRRTVDVVLSDLRHAGNWPGRARLLTEHLFPPRAYMGARYPRWPAPLLPAAYIYRIVRGAPAWFRR